MELSIPVPVPELPNVIPAHPCTFGQFDESKKKRKQWCKKKEEAKKVKAAQEKIRKENREKDEEEDQPLQSCPYCGAESVTNIHIRALGKIS